MADDYPWPPKILSKSGYYDLGRYHRQVTTTSADAQLWFNRGLIWCYAFNHEEAARCFEHASSFDPECGMAYWGLAYCLGPNYNMPWEFFPPDTLAAVIKKMHDTVQRARACKNMSPAEKALVEALKYRYPQDKPPEDCSIWNKDYADAMQKVYDEFPNDHDVAALYADAMMNLNPWDMWDITKGIPNPNARTLQTKQVLDQAFTEPGALEHPGLLHLYIHLMEMCPTPEAALNIADHLRGLVPDAGHLNHMPSHLDIICGNYQRAIQANSDASLADARYLEHAGYNNFYTLYRVHNYHFKIYGAMFAGQLQPALETCTLLENAIPESLLRTPYPPMANLLESFLAMRLHVLIRFGRWRDIIALPLPSDPVLYCATTAFTHYAKSLAHAALRDLPAAHSHRKHLTAAAAAVPDSRTQFNNKAVDLLALAAAMLDGELAYRAGQYDAAWAHLQHAIALDDSLPYDEPWGWMQPTRHAYGALLLEQGRVEDARAVYRLDLGLDESLPRPQRHPRNVWALAGLAKCEARLGREEEKEEVERMLEEARAAADVEVETSCFCALGAAEA